jgi:hypothetical protein
MMGIYDNPDEIAEDSDDAIAEDMTNFEPDNRNADSAPIGATITNWRRLTDQDAPAVWNELRDWVEWFTVRFDIPVSTVPPCWWKHPRLVEELSGLHTAHIAGYDHTDSGLGPIDWLERLATAMPRLTRAYAGGCSRGHTDPKPRSWADATDEQEWTVWAQSAHTSRGTPGRVSPNRKEDR